MIQKHRPKLCMKLGGKRSVNTADLSKITPACVSTTRPSPAEFSDHKPASNHSQPSHTERNIYMSSITQHADSTTHFTKDFRRWQFMNRSSQHQASPASEAPSNRLLASAAEGISIKIYLTGLLPHIWTLWQVLLCPINSYLCVKEKCLFGWKIKNILKLSIS